jgi:hypothetical protein
LGAINQDPVTEYIKRAIDMSGSYLMEDIMYSLHFILPKDLQYKLKYHDINNRLNALKITWERKKKIKIFDYAV